MAQTSAYLWPISNEIFGGEIGHRPGPRPLFSDKVFQSGARFGGLEDVNHHKL